MPRHSQLNASDNNGVNMCLNTPAKFSAHFMFHAGHSVKTLLPENRICVWRPSP